MKVYTIGYSGKSLENFIKELKREGIDMVVDIRAFPTSKYESFKKENLKAFLHSEKIGYIHIPELGGFRKPSYEEYTKTEEFKVGLRKLMKIASSSNAVIMCLEKNPKSCHRRFISSSLESLGVEVVHLV
jgi:uncharacterized protein (DUF488 family)